MSEIQISHRTAALLEVPHSIQGFAHFGGKGSAKTSDLALMNLQWCELLGDKARCLILRRHYPDLEGVTTILMSFLADIYGAKQARRLYNGSDNYFRLPNGGFIQMGGLFQELDCLRYRGRNWNMLSVDEYPQYDGPKLVNRVRAELRGGPGVRPRVLLTGNPGLAGHDHTFKTFIKGRVPWQPWTEEHTGLRWITIPSNASENPFLDHEEHMKQIAAIAADDPDLAKALQTGDFTAIKGGEFFGTAWNEKASVIPAWPLLPDWNFKFFLSLDHGGGSAPTVALFCALAMEDAYGPHGDIFPRGSLIIFDEVHDAVDGSWNETLGYSIAKNCESIKQRADEYDMRASGLGDPQILQDHGAATKLHDEYSSNGVSLNPWRKQRREQGGTIVRELMHHSRPPHDRRRPGLYVTTNCAGFLGTVPFIARDRNNRSQPATDGADHWYDACAGAAAHKRESFAITELRA